MKLITFLGKGEADRDGQYALAAYQFDPRTVISESFFGLALASVIDAGEIVVLGTRGSMWDVFFSSRADSLTTDQRRLLHPLADAVREERVTQSQVEVLAASVSPVLGRTLRCHIVSYGESKAAQIEILKTIDSAVVENEAVAIDITHAFRHLPMIALVSALLLRKAKRVKVRGVYYGAREMTSRAQSAVTPVIRLDGLLDIVDWIEAVTAYDWSGDYGALSPVLARDIQGGEPVARALERASFHERLGRIDPGAKELAGLDQLLDGHIGEIADLFRSALRQRTAWRHEPRMWMQQAELAKQSLSRRDYLRAVMLAMECHVSRLVEEQGGDPYHYPTRATAREEWRSVSKAVHQARKSGQPVARDSRRDAYFRLDDLRNALAHGTPPMQAVNRNFLADEKALREQLQRTFRDLGL